MAEKFIGSLIYGDHPIPKKYKPWKERLKVPLAIAAVLLVIGVIAWKYANYPEENVVRQFLEAVKGSQYDAAYSQWDNNNGHYSLKDFIIDFGKDGYYTQGMKVADIIDSNTAGSAVIVYVQIDTFKQPLAIMVNKENKKLSFSPTNKYKR